MTTSTLDLASLLCSRLCHDMLSPVGALSNGLELLADEDDPEMRQRCFELLEQSARISTDKLKFFRLAFGAAGGFGERIAVSEAKALIEALVAGNARITINWAISADALPKPAIKTLLNFALFGIEALVRGGTLDLAGELRPEQIGDGTAELVVRASGPRIAFDHAVGRALEGSLPDAEMSSRTAPAAMLHQLAETLGGRLQFAIGEDALVLGAVLPGA
ncbi:histidine phosphotransferase family protein [Novosphingobium sp. 1949]|uniref:Histidine phosphotransferase family protein n=1 Tax=Novosphingobium organovorum TaxID=2930092 RepID=A0ABT0BDU9_9SPHN|nr:histidine phosphotransferase family protein [Novosphingobium organovorum]MCJ2183237.1 histidine phosphotransferase family protein [Novosphingobium organovorum]